jgi:hypothetical protein
MTLPDGYSLETIANSSMGPDTELEVGGLNVRANDNLLASTRGGELWEMDSDSREWTRLTDSLHQTLGVWTEDDEDGIWVMQKPELTRLVDDSPAPGIDMYETVCDEFGISGDYHEFGFGPVRDSEGNFYFNLNLGAEGGGPLTGVMVYSAPYRGYAYKVTPDGEVERFADGYRSPAGIGINGDDELFYSDNQGDWVPVCHIAHVTEGSFHGHPHSLGPRDEFPSYENLDEADTDEFLATRKPPVVWIPYNLAESTGGVTFDQQGNFGPFEGQAFYGCQRNANLSRLYMEEVNGSYQGVTFPFSDVGDFQCGTLREEFSNDGSSLYMGETDRGWGSVSGEPYGIQRVDYDGETVPFEMHSVEIMESGFRVNFTKAATELDAQNPNNWDISHWTYNYHSSYGSNRVNETSVDTSEVTPTVVDDGMAVELELPSVGPADVSGTRTVQGRIYGIEADGITAQDDSEMTQPVGYYTVNDVPN